MRRTMAMCLAGAGAGIALMLTGLTQHGLAQEDGSAAPLSLEDHLPVDNPQRDEVPFTPERPGMAGYALDEAVLPLLRGLPPREELDKVREAIFAYHREDGEAGRKALAGVRDKLARKLVAWYAHRSGVSNATPEQIEEFRNANPYWPQDGLRKAAEGRLLIEGVEPARVIAFFADGTPETGAGKAALSLAYLKKGERERARALVRSAWREHDLDDEVEQVIADKLLALLEPADHAWRVDRFLMQDSRWRGTRNARVERARNAARFLNEAEQKAVRARIAVYTRQTGKATKLYAELDGDEIRKPGVYLQKVQLLRRQDRDRAAWKLLIDAPTDPNRIVSPDDWWEERRVNAYRALYAKEYRTAYRIVSDTGPVGINAQNESRFMAGWIALRFLDDPDAALKHFLAMTRSADGPRTRSTSHYWVGRTYHALGKQDQARAFYGKAALEFNTYYGQIARQTLDPDSSLIRIAPPEVPDARTVRWFRESDAVQATVIAQKAGVSAVMRVFLNHLRFKLETAGRMVLLAQLATALGDTQLAVRIGKTGMIRRFNLVNYAYPTHAMPDFEPLRELPEQAILFAIARQESEFNTLVQSGAGARGILQVMPITARHVCRQYRITCRIADLKKDPAYNAKLASAYIGDRQDEFTGSYIMTFAGYNAGPGRVRYWMRNIGDPRDPSVDPIDWVELVHIKETRHYIKKVLANVQVYRSRLGQEKRALQIARDIQRARDGLQSASN